MNDSDLLIIPASKQEPVGLYCLQNKLFHEIEGNERK